MTSIKLTVSSISNTSLTGSVNQTLAEENLV